ncbi:nuclear transport factor 2 family protein [Actinophytocola sp.]|uniref:nuclear transport factor 2 family protein n=1 Tax=Actinophytocola sp. TaxID=1872138 RepID=UPI002D7FFCA8|nr:nuclear transport factor 2 family protein [Actinophytocola sp.]HET9143005.1 nuclear transport factor 2 family protein [Actinophytocola sp.]
MDQTVADFVDRFNEAVSSGDWGKFARWFTDDAVIEFSDVPVPAMRGRAEIEAGYRSAPPDDTITMTDCRSSGDVHEVAYRWDTEGMGGGRFRLTMRDGLVAHNVISLTS